MQAPSTSRYSALLEKKPRDTPTTTDKSEAKDDDEEPEGDDEQLSEISEELDYDKDDEEESSNNESSGSDEDADEEKQADVSMADAEEQELEAGEDEDDSQPRRERKRKRKDDNEDLEAKYMAGLTKDEEKEPSGKRQKAEDKDKADENDAVPVHESLAQESKDSDLEKASRTVFLANVSTEAISSKAARKTLITHLSTALDPHDMPVQKFESIRFRSVAFSTGSMPKRAAFITKSLMGATTKSANAYAVFSTAAAARAVISKLNGTEVLGRHLRVDSVAHPSPTDHRRCVFVGNLGFVDDETVVNTNEDGETVEKKRTKVPSDIEEGLWRTFSKTGKVENVRVVRDPKTRVGKGFAYVQFYVSSIQLPKPTTAHLTTMPGRQRRRSRSPPRRQEIPTHAPPQAPRNTSQGPSQDGQRPRTRASKGECRRHQGPQHKIHPEIDTRATSRRRQSKQTPRSRWRVHPPQEIWRRRYQRHRQPKACV